MGLRRQRVAIRLAPDRYTVAYLLDSWKPRYQEQVVGPLTTLGFAVLTLEDDWFVEVFVEQVDCSLKEAILASVWKGQP